MRKLRVYYIENFAEWLLAFMLILEVNTVFSESYYYNFYISEIACVLAIVLGLLIIHMHKSVKRKTLIFIALYEMLVLVFLLASVGKNVIVAYSVKFIMFLPLVVLIYTVKPKAAISILEKQSKIIVFLAFMSLIMWFFGAILSILPSMGSFVISWGGTKTRTIYGGFLYAGQMLDIYGIRVVRNTGIFTEGPMYGFVLVMALVTQIFVSGSRDKKSIIILILTIITTMSVAGIIAVIGIMFVKVAFFKDEESIFYSKGLRVIAVIVAVPIAAVLVNELMNYKMTTGNSYSIRLDDYIAGFSAWKTRPFFGTGYGSYDVIVSYMQRNTSSGAGYSNSVAYILATCGIYGISLYIYAVFQGVRISIKAKRRGLAMMFIILCGMLVVTLVPMHLFVLNYLGIGISLGICGTKAIGGGSG